MSWSFELFTLVACSYDGVWNGAGRDAAAAAAVVGGGGGQGLIDESSMDVVAFGGSFVGSW